MEVEKIKGRITTLGDNVTRNVNEGTGSVYSYIEFEGGRIVKNLHSMLGVDGHLRKAYETDEQVELHVATGGKIAKGIAMLLAVQRVDGRIFGIAPASASGSGAFIGFAVLFLAGLVLLPVFGIGILAWILLYNNWHKNSMASEMKSYVAGIPGVIAL